MDLSLTYKLSGEINEVNFRKDLADEQFFIYLFFRVFDSKVDCLDTKMYPLTATHIMYRGTRQSNNIHYFEGQRWVCASVAIFMPPVDGVYLSVRE